MTDTPPRTQSHRSSLLFLVGVWGVVAGLGAGCVQAYVPPPPSPVDSAEAREDLNLVFTSYWREMVRRRPRFATAIGQRVDNIVTPAIADADDDRTRYVALRLGRDLGRVDADALSPRDYASLQTLRWELDLSAEGASMGKVDFGFLSSSESTFRDAVEVLLDHPFTSSGDLSRYLFLLDGTALWALDAMGALRARRDAGIVAPREAITDFARWMRHFRTLAEEHALDVAPARLVSVDTALVEAFRLQEREGITERLIPSIDSLLVALDDYKPAALERTGVWQYPGGKEFYRHLLRRRLGLEVDPEEAHRAGLSELRRVDSLLRLVQPRLSGAGPLRLDSLRGLAVVAPRAVGAIVQGVEARLRELPDTLRPRVLGLPDSLPRVRAATALEAWLHPEGMVRPPEFVNSATELVVTPWWGSTTAQLEGPGRTYRWAWPGRALASAVSYSGGVLNPMVVLHASRTAVEGWGEYAGSLAGELGFYREPLAMWGQLMHEGLNAAWLVVDTGIHYYGWSKAQAMAVLRPFSTATNAELDSMYVARVVQSPGSAGAAVLGGREFAAMRTWMQRVLGREFSVAAWHHELLTMGPVPLPVLAAHLEWWGWDLRQRLAARDAVERQAKKTRRP